MNKEKQINIFDLLEEDLVLIEDNNKKVKKYMTFTFNDIKCDKSKITSRNLRDLILHICNEIGDHKFSQKFPNKFSNNIEIFKKSANKALPIRKNGEYYLNTHDNINHKLEFIKKIQKEYPMFKIEYQIILK
jgi:hypothetical protein